MTRGIEAGRIWSCLGGQTFGVFHVDLSLHFFEDWHFSPALHTKATYNPLSFCLLDHWFGFFFLSFFSKKQNCGCEVFGCLDSSFCQLWLASASLQRAGPIGIMVTDLYMVNATYLNVFDHGPSSNLSVVWPWEKKGSGSIKQAISCATYKC